GARPGRCPPLPAQGLGHRQEAPPEGRGAQGGPLPHPARAGASDAGRARRDLAPRLGGRRRRDGPSSWFRQELRQRGERYLLTVPSNTLVQDLASAPAPYSGPWPSPGGAVAAGGRLVRRLVGAALGDGRGARLGEGAAGGPGRL